jgi:phage FluMu protein gp41
MSPNTPTATPTTQDLFSLTLRVGLPVERDGKTIHYRLVKLREVDVSDERWAVRQAERLVLWQGQPRLVVSDVDHKLALTARHIEAFVCDSLRLDRDLIDLDLVGKLKPVDLAAIEERVFQIEVAAKVRYGEITQAQYDEMFSAPVETPAAPQPVGPAAVDGAAAPADGSGPVMLADHSGQGAAGAASGLGR